MSTTASISLGVVAPCNPESVNENCQNEPVFATLTPHSPPVNEPVNENGQNEPVFATLKPHSPPGATLTANLGLQMEHPFKPPSPPGVTANLGLQMEDPFESLDEHSHEPVYAVLGSPKSLLPPPVDYWGEV